jgi:hypothetical protein
MSALDLATNLETQLSTQMAFSYVENKVVDCSVSPDLSYLKGKTVVVSGGK